jgi:hypothetical protein
MTTSNVIHFPTGRPVHHDIVAVEPVYPPAIVHREFPAWVDAEMLQVIRLMEGTGWDIRHGGVGRLWCRHPRVESRGWVDFSVAVGIERLWWLARIMRAKQ